MSVRSLIGRARRLLKSVVVASLLLGVSAARVSEQDDGVSIQFIGAGWFVNDKIVSGTSPGHAFVCMTYHLRAGVKEDCWGFYPKNAIAYIYGPGIVDSEFKDSHDFHFTKAIGSIEKQLTAKQRQEVLATLNEWQAKHYSLSVQNCIALVDAVAKAAGLKRPPTITGLLPASYIAELKKLNP